MEDWKIDVEREKADNDAASFPENGRQALAIKEEESNEGDEEVTIQYERLSEFFFDLCLSWCQHLDIETYIFFLNGVFLNITDGNHLNVSAFKEMEDITVLPVSFFNKLLEYRNLCE